VESLSKKFDEKLLFENITFEIIRGEKVALLGKNGSGKTTLIKMIMEGNESIKLAENIKIAYLDQNTEFENTNITIFEYLERETEIKYDDIRQTLSKFHFYGEDVNKKIDSLSGGEKSRLKLLVMITNGFNFLILDEPTNHLDIEFKEVFEEVLNEYEGTLLFISHDRYFINSVAQRILEIDNQKIYDYEGNYEYYKAKKPNNVEKIEIIEKVIEKSKKKFSNNYIKNLEKDIENTETEIEILKGKLQSENNYNLLTEISKELETLEENLHNLMGKWMETNWD
jgi:ATPase subunit of ABC transporter with duplicated ATPase domains